MRRNEILSLRFSQVDVARGVIYLYDTKNGERRGVPLAGRALESMRVRAQLKRGDNDLVFAGKTKGSLVRIDRMILDTPEGAIVPVRAIYFVTGRAFPPRAITSAIADGRQDANFRIFETLLYPGHVDAAGALNAAAYGELESYAEEVGRLCEAGASLIDQIQAMPAGVYISRDQLQSLVNETNDVCGGPEGNGFAPIAIRGQPMVSPAVRALVLQGFEPYTRGRRDRRPKPSKPRRRGLSSEEAEDSIEVKTIALGLWAGGCRSMQRMLKVPSLDRYINDWGKRKVLAWLSAADSRRPESKPGRRWPKQTK